MHYLDNAATTAVAPEVIQVVADTLAEHWANPSSLYAQGMRAQMCIDAARKDLAAALGCDAKNVYFTASGTEASNIAILGAARARRGWGTRLVATGYEHPAVLGPLQMLEKHEGFSLTRINPGPDGRVDMEELARAVRSDTALVCAMQVNNETGAVLDVAALATRVKAQNSRTAVHVDGVQGFCKLPFIGLAATQIDSYAVSGHKLHAPKGVGALYLRKGFHILPPLLGGGQEDGVRPGTENIAYIAGFAAAVRLMQKNRVESARHIQALRQRLLEGLETLSGIQVNSPPDAYAGILNFSLPKVRSETMLHFLEQREVLVSSGSACSKGQASHTLTAMGLAADRIDTALRVSYDGYNTEEDIDALLAGLREGLATLAH